MKKPYVRHNCLPQPYCARGAGIYAIINRNNRKVYIGSAVCLRHRWSEHRHCLSRRNHNSRYFQRAFDKDPDAFYIEVIEELKSPDKTALLAREQFWIDFYKSYLPENGYNICPKAQSCQGIKRSHEFLQKVSRSLSKPWPEERRKAWGELRRANPPHGWKWSEETRIKQVKSHTGLKWSESQRAGRMRWLANNPQPCNKAVYQCSMDGTVIQRFDSITLAEKALGVTRSNISLVCKGKRPYCFGFKWRYA